MAKDLHDTKGGSLRRVNICSLEVQATQEASGIIREQGGKAITSSERNEICAKHVESDISGPLTSARSQTFFSSACNSAWACSWHHFSTTNRYARILPCYIPCPGKPTTYAQPFKHVGMTNDFSTAGNLEMLSR